MPLPTLGEYLVDVVGESHYQRNLSTICGARKRSGEYLERWAKLVLDNQNQYDANAVAVEINGLKVGHLSRANAVSFRRYLESAGAPAGPYLCPCVIVGGWKRSANDVGSYGVVIDINVPGMEMRDEPPFEPYDEDDEDDDDEDDDDEDDDDDVAERGSVAATVQPYTFSVDLSSHSSQGMGTPKRSSGLPWWVWTIIIIVVVLILLRACGG